MAVLIRAGATARRREWLAQVRLRVALEASLERKLSAELRRAARAAAKGFVDGREQGLGLALQDHMIRLTAILEPGWIRTFQSFGARVFDVTKSLGVMFDTKDVESEFLMRTRAWIRRFGAQKVVQIDTATRNGINHAVDSGLAEGESITAIAKRVVDKTGGVIAARRAIVIARTEVHTASQAAAQEAADVVELGENKRDWISAEDERTRETHVVANGQIRGMKEPFDVGGAKLLHPGDPSGPPEEVIQCRCVVGIVIE